MALKTPTYVHSEPLNSDKSKTSSTLVAENMSATVRQLAIERSFRAPGTHLCGMAWDGRWLWHSDGDTNLLYRLDPDTGSVVDEVPCSEVRTDLAYDGEYLWQIAGHPKRIRVVAPSEGSVIREVQLGPDAEEACGLAVSPERYWVGFKKICRIQERSHSHVVGRILRGSERLSGLATRPGELWFTDYEKSLLLGIDLGTGEETSRYSLPGSPNGLAWDGSRFWYGDYANKRICAVRV